MNIILHLQGCKSKMSFVLCGCLKKKDKQIKKKDRSMIDLDEIDDISSDNHANVKCAEDKFLNLSGGSSIDFFNLENKRYVAKCVKCYDGDTVHLIFRYPDNDTGKLWKWRCRITGIDTPEIKSLNVKEQDLAKSARDCLTSLILDKNVMADTKGFDKYGRLLVDITVNFEGHTINVSQYLIEKGYAKPYFGGTKSDWTL